MVLLAHKYEDARQIWAGIWAAYPRDVDLVGREGGRLTCSSLFLSHIRSVGVSEAGFRLRRRIGSGFNQVTGSGSVFGIRIKIQEGKNDPQKKKKIRIFMFYSAGCSLLNAEGFFCNLDFLYGGLGKGKL
jgi:hypothetical protein